VDPTLPHLQSLPPSTFRHMSSTQHHPDLSLSPFLTSTCHLLPGVLPPHPPIHPSSSFRPTALQLSLSLSHSTSPHHPVPQPPSLHPHGPSSSHHPLTSYHVSLFLSQSPPPVWSSLLLIHLCPAFHVTSTHPPLPIMHPVFAPASTPYPLGRSADPGGSARRPPRPKSAELAGPFSVPRKQLLR
jgi:hypothetical protein